MCIRDRSSAVLNHLRYSRMYCFSQILSGLCWESNKRYLITRQTLYPLTILNSRCLTKKYLYLFLFFTTSIHFILCEKALWVTSIVRSRQFKTAALESLYAMCILVREQILCVNVLVEYNLISICKNKSSHIHSCIQISGIH